MEILGYSKGLYSSWFLNKPERLLFDCGEGCALNLGDNVFTIEKLLFSHGHMDHIGGLLSFINIRNSIMGTTDKPLDIYYPNNDIYIERLLPYLKFSQPNLKYKLTFNPVVPGQIIPISPKKHIRAFPTEHSRGLTLGYVVEETRKKLTPEFSHLNEKEIQTGIRNGSIDKTKLMTTFTHPSFAYALDAFKFNPNDVKGVETIILDTTFIDPKTRHATTHATVEEGIQMAMAAGVSGRAILAHFSPRYNHHEILAEVDRVTRKLKPDFAVLPMSDQRRPQEFSYTLRNQVPDQSR